MWRVIPFLPLSFPPSAAQGIDASHSLSRPSVLSWKKKKNTKAKARDSKSRTIERERPTTTTSKDCFCCYTVNPVEQPLKRRPLIPISVSCLRMTARLPSLASVPRLPPSFHLPSSLSRALALAFPLPSTASLILSVHSFLRPASIADQQERREERATHTYARDADDRTQEICIVRSYFRERQ